MIDINDDRSERVKYDYSDYPIYIRRDFLSNFPNYTAESHWHEDIELIAIISGEMLYNVNGEIITLGEGDGIFINARQFHFGFSEEKQECDFICILFHPMILCTTKLFETEYIEPLLNSKIPYFHLSKKILWQKNILECILKMNEKNGEKSFLLQIHGLLCLLWHELIENVNLEKPITNKTDYNLTVLKNMVGFIHENYQGCVTLADIAKAGHISKRTCGTLFVKYQNKTPVEFLVYYRLRKSIELMKTTDMTILEISLAVGFSGARYYA